MDILRSVGSIVANAPQQLRDQVQSMPGGQEEVAMSTAQFVHFGDSPLLLIPGTNSTVITLRRDGGVESTSLHLPQGFAAESLVSSDRNWVVRASDGGTSPKLSLLRVDPASGDALGIIHTGQVSPRNVTCFRDDGYYAIQWVNEKQGPTPFFMIGAP